jgi:hypothetical protein
MNLIRWWRERRRQQEVEARAIEQMRHEEETGESPEPKEVKLSQLRD